MGIGLWFRVRVRIARLAEVEGAGGDEEDVVGVDVAHLVGVSVGVRVRVSGWVRPPVASIARVSRARGDEQRSAQCVHMDTLRCMAAAGDASCG